MGTTPVVAAILEALDDDALDALADLLAPRIADRLPRQADDCWLDSQSAAEYLSVPRSRIHDLVGLRRLPVHRDGRKLIFRKSDLDRYLAVSGS
jgi:excisionase family DNA binding protein